MKHHEFYNAIWSHRDAEFWWDGIKTGALFGSFVGGIAMVGICVLIDSIIEKNS